jgi:hypothetical protein
VEEVDEQSWKVHDEFSSEQSTSITLKRIMESEIQKLVTGYRCEMNQENPNKEGNKDNKEDAECQWCKDGPCVWASNRNGMVEWDKNKHEHLVGDDLPNNSTRRKYMYRQMALTILEGPLGKGNIIVLPNCVKNGI